MLRVIQSYLMVYTRRKAMYFSFKHYIVPKVHKTEEDIKASAVYLNCQDMCSDSPNRMKKMAGSSSQD